MMVYSESLARRIRGILNGQQAIVEKKMFGGIGFLLRGNLLVGIWGDSLIARVGTPAAAAVLAQPHVRAMDITGRPMKGWVIVEPEGIEVDEQLQDWIALAHQFVVTLSPK